MFRSRWGYSTKAAALLVLALCVVPAPAQIGPIFTAAGPVNRSMAGASTAAPLDASGAMYWNPATISGLPGSSIDFGVELLYPQTRLASFIPASAFGPGIPPVGFGGSDRGDNGVFAIPTMALVYRPDDSNVTYGLGVFTVGGFGVNYRADPTNPILSPQPPNGFGVGSLYSNLQVLELTPTVSLQLTDRLSIGGGPTLALAHLEVDPQLLAIPNANGQYPIGSHTRMSWGGGFQFGIFYKMDNGWNLGTSVKSPQWLDSFHYQSATATGAPRDISYRFNLPLIYSLGVAYTGIERWTFAADFRYLDFGHTEGFKQSGYTGDGAVAGLGFRSVFALAFGAQYQLTDTIAVRAGYTYNQDPIRSDVETFNIASPVILEHTMYLGFSYQVSNALSLNFAYLHGFQSSLEGQYITPFGAIPGSTIRSTTSADSLMLGATVRFGGCH